MQRHYHSAPASLSAPSTTSEALHQRVSATTISNFDHHSTLGYDLVPARYQQQLNIEVLLILIKMCFRVSGVWSDFIRKEDGFSLSFLKVFSYDVYGDLIRYFLFGRHLDELHVTWAHLKKKRTRLRTNTKTLEDLCSQRLEMTSQAIHDAVIPHQVTTSQYLRRRDENSIRTLGDFSRPSHEGYMNTIELLEGNNMWFPRHSVLHGKSPTSLREYVYLHTDEARDARLSKFEADFKQQQCEMTNKIDIVLKANTDRIAGTPPSDIVKNPKLGTHPVLSARSYPIIDPQCSSHLSTSINVIKAHFNDAIIEPQQTEEPNQPLMTNLRICILTCRSAFIQGETPAKIRDPGLFTLPCRLGDSEPFDTLSNLGSCVNIILLYLFKKLNIGLLEETGHIFGLADGTKSYPVGIIKDVVVHIGKLKLLNDFYILNMKNDPETPLLVGRGFLAIVNAVIDCRMAKITVREGITRSTFSVKGIDLDGIGAKPPYYVRKDFIDCHLPGEWEISRDAELNPFKDTLVFRRMLEFLGAIPINLKCNMWESEDLIEKPIYWSKPPKTGMGHGMPKSG
nr:hypothetical protein [Tanacetum cinerariifolium]